MAAPKHVAEAALKVGEYINSLPGCRKKFVNVYREIINRQAKNKCREIFYTAIKQIILKP
jgi:hypothetical protein